LFVFVGWCAFISRSLFTVEIIPLLLFVITKLADNRLTNTAFLFLFLLSIYSETVAPRPSRQELGPNDEPAKRSKGRGEACAA
jgi:hypothetical protein